MRLLMDFYPIISSHLSPQAISTYATEDGANWEVHPETGCVQFKYCPPTPSCATTTTTTTTTTPPPFMTRNTGFMVGTKNAEAEFVSLNPDTEPLPACMKGGLKKFAKWKNCYPTAFVNQGKSLSQATLETTFLCSST